MCLTCQYFVNDCGLSQDNLAVLIGTSRSTLTRHMQGWRELPTIPSMRLVKLFAATLQAPKALPKAETREAKAKRKRKLERLEMDKKLLEYRLKQAAAAEKKLATLAHLLSRVDDADITYSRLQRSLLSVLASRHKKKTNELEDHREKLNLRLAALEQMVRMLRG